MDRSRAISALPNPRLLHRSWRRARLSLETRMQGVQDMDAPMIDQTKLESFLVRAVGDLSAGYGGVMVSLGSKLGLYKAMSGAGPVSSKELAARTGCAERYVSEWLNAQAAGGYVGYHAVSDTYELSPE